MARPASDLTVACVLRSSGDYDASYVGKLQRGVMNHLNTPYRFICFSDCDVPCERVPLKYPWPGWFSKLHLFSPEVEHLGRVLYFDLDTVITGDLADIAVMQQTVMLSDFNVPNVAQSGVMMLMPEARAAVWDEWIVYPETHMQRLGGHGDGGFIRDVYTGGVARWQDLLPGQIVSYKNHILPSGNVPEGTRVVCYHGRPRPRETELWNRQP